MAKIELKDIIDFIIENTDDTKAMDTISNLAFPHTTRYKERYGRDSSSPATSTGAE